MIPHFTFFFTLLITAAAAAVDCPGQIIAPTTADGCLDACAEVLGSPTMHCSFDAEDVCRFHAPCRSTTEDRGIVNTEANYVRGMEYHGSICDPFRSIPAGPVKIEGSTMNCVTSCTAADGCMFVHTIREPKADGKTGDYACIRYKTCSRLVWPESSNGRSQVNEFRAGENRSATARPTMPTNHPTELPTVSPTKFPTAAPTKRLTARPTTKAPTRSTPVPTPATPKPTPKPVAAPTQPPKCRHRCTAWKTIARGGRVCTNYVCD